MQGDADQTSVKIAYKQTIKEYKLDNHPSIFMVSAPCQKVGWQEFVPNQSAGSKSAFLVFNLIWKSAHELVRIMRPSELPVFLKETWETSEALSAWNPFPENRLAFRNSQSEPPSPVVPCFLSIPLFNNYSMNELRLDSLKSIDLLHAKRLLSLDYLQVHLATVFERKKGVRESTVNGQATKFEARFYSVKWISSIETWEAPPVRVWADLHLIGEPSAKMYSVKDRDNQSHSLYPVQHPVLLIRPKWTAISRKIDYPAALADLQHRLPDALKQLVSKRTLSDDDRYVTDFKQLVSSVCRENAETTAPGQLLELLTLANKLNRFKEGLDILNVLASRKYSTDNELEQLDSISDFIVNTGKQTILPKKQF